MNTYTENSIESLDPLAFTRLKPQVYCGDTTYSTQLLVEIFSNAVDEFCIGHGNKIEISFFDGKYLSVRDYGQGFLPEVYREDGKTVLEAAFSVLNTSGKYREDGTYEGTSLGNFGIGAKLAVFLSHESVVTTYRDGKYEKVFFKEGVFDKREVGEQGNNPTGTFVEWTPSEEFFKNVGIEIGSVRKLLAVTAALCKGLTIILNVDDKVEKFYSEHGIDDLVDDAIGNSEIIKNRLRINFEEGKYKMDLVMTYTSNYSSTIIPYVNTGLTISGTHITQLKTALTREFNKFIREQGWLKEKDGNLTGDDVQEGMYMIFNLTAPNVAYDAQVKSRVTEIDTKRFVEVFSENFRNWCEVNKSEVRAIAEKSIKAKKAREAAKKTREKIRDISKKDNKKGLKAKIEISQKFIDCVSKNPRERNLMLVEGNSAASAAIEARNAKTDCIYMLRGKVLSTLKCTVDKILENQELSDIIKVIGAGFGDEFDPSKINFDKIVITTDQDSDGMNIELLLITFFYTYMRPLVEAGKLYRAVTPLYIITSKLGKEYCYTEQELDEWRKNNPNVKYDLAHCKGLGEVNPATLKEICFDRQNYKRITISDVEKTTELLNILMGKDVAPRKQYIYDNANELGFNFI